MSRIYSRHVIPFFCEAFAPLVVKYFLMRLGVNGLHTIFVFGSQSL
jgi:hypothetical protein